MALLPEVTIKQLKPIDVWRAKDDMAKREWDSRKFWAGIEDDRRVAIILVVQESLLRLIENPDAWIPTSVDPSNGDRLDITVSILLPQLTEEELNQRVSAERLVNHTTAALQKLERELRE